MIMRKAVHIRFTLSAFLLAVVLLAMRPTSVHAVAEREDWMQIRMSQEAIQRGYTLATPSGSLVLGLFPNITDRPARVTLVKNSPEISEVPAGWKLVSDVYEYDIKTKPVQILNREAILVLKYSSASNARRMIRYWDSIHRIWVPLRSVDLGDQQAIRAFSRLPYSKIAVFEESTTFEGIATWYRAPNRTMSASTNNYSIGSQVRVTNTETGKSIVVEVYSTWAGSEGRVIDLTRDAFAALGRVGAGTMRVRTELVRPTPDAAVTTAAPAITAASAIVVDASQDRMLWEKNLHQRPIASLTKLMTALVVLDTQPDFRRELEYIADDNTTTEGSFIELYPGDTLAFDEALKATLIASANNAAKLLSRTSVSSKAEFVRRMNEKAKSLKMHFTRFVEPTGLDSGNVSTPGDIAKLLEAAMKHPEIRRLTMMTEDAISANTFGPKSERIIRYGNTNKLIGALPGLVGGKTGYLGYGNATFALKFVNGSRSRIIVILGSTNGTTRNDDMMKLARWALAQAF